MRILHKGELKIKLCKSFRFSVSILVCKTQMSIFYLMFLFILYKVGYRWFIITYDTFSCLSVIYTHFLSMYAICIFRCLFLWCPVWNFLLLGYQVGDFFVLCCPVANWMFLPIRKAICCDF